jgi:hypothetical protein
MYAMGKLDFSQASNRYKLDRFNPIVGKSYQGEESKKEGKV